MHVEVDWLVGLFQVSIITEDEFLDLLNRKKASLPSYASPEGRSAAGSSNISSSHNNNNNFARAAGKSTVKEEGIAIAPGPLSVSRTVSGLTATNKLPTAPWAEKHAALIDDQLWVDKYKPSKIEDMIGSNELVSKLS